jgi:hypothetical protein
MHDAPVGKRPGRKAYKPSASARERVMTYIAAGMTLPQIADALVIGRTTLCKCFVAELAAGRAKRMAENIDLLRKAAKSSSVSAMRTLYAGQDGGQPKLGQKARAALAAQTAGVGTEWEGDLLPSQPQALDDDQATDWGTDLYPAGNYGRFREFEK